MAGIVHGVLEAAEFTPEKVTAHSVNVEVCVCVCVYVCIRERERDI